MISPLKSTVRNLPASIKCWTAGLNPARCHLPSSTIRLKITEKFEENFPADFIVEYVGQVRGAWFYYVHAVNIALAKLAPLIRTARKKRL